MEAAKRTLLEPYLSLKVLDPAMGSGHFLVGAADYLSFAIATDPHLPPVPNCEKPQAYYKRLVVQHCLFGVDLNQLAVELAKVSLWMHTVSRDKALSFLDHHLRWGNSLIGARLEEDLRTAPPPVSGSRQSGSELQTEMTFDAVLERNDLVAFLDAFQKIVEPPAGDAEVERQKDAWYREMDEKREPYRQVANLWLAPYFGVQVSPEQYGQALDALRAGRGSDQWKGLTETDWFQEAQEIAKRRDRRFFHWELEFPEAFFGVRSGAADFKPEDWRGFDAVIGNPPYVRLHGIDDKSKAYLWAAMDTFRAKADYYTCFIERAVRLARIHGTVGMITSDSWLHLDSFDALRRFLLDESELKLIWDLPHGVFPDANVETVVFTLRRGTNGNDCNMVKLFAGADQTKGGPRVSLGSVNQAAFEDTYKNVFDLSLPVTSWIRDRIQLISAPLGDFANVDFGLKTGDDAKFIVEKSEAVLDKPLLRGSNIGRYTLEYADEYVHYDPKTMISHRSTARPGESARFEQPKMLVRDTTDVLMATFDSEHYYVKDVLIVAPPLKRLLALTALLNSSAVRWLYETMFPTVHVQRQELSSVPIRCIDFEHPTSESAMEDALASAREALINDDLEQPFWLAHTALAAHAAHHGPAGKDELRHDEYWANEIPGMRKKWRGLLQTCARTSSTTSWPSLRSGSLTSSKSSTT